MKRWLSLTQISVEFRELTYSFPCFMEMCQIVSLRLYMLLYSDGFTYAVCVKIFSGLFFFFSGTTSIAKFFCVLFYEFFKGLSKAAFKQG